MRSASVIYTVTAAARAVRAMRAVSVFTVFSICSLPTLPARAEDDRASSVTPAAAAARPAVAADDDDGLARTARLDTILRLAVDRNRDLAENGARALAADARREIASRLPELEAKYEQWGVPLARPFALDRADTVMFGVRQAFPAWGTRDARERAAAEDAGSAHEAARARRQNVVAQVRRTFAAYYRADQELRLHLEHVGLTSRVLELARLNQRTGHGRLQDILRLELELTRLHTDIAGIEREGRSSRALLNALMDRAPDAPLGPPEDLVIATTTTATATATTNDVATLETGIDVNRPEIAVAARAIRRGEAVLEEARRSARLPSVMVGLDYWYMPMNQATRHGYGAMVSMNLPWFGGRREFQQREAEHVLRAEHHALESVRNAVRYELRDAAGRLQAARQSFRIIDQDLLGQARRSLEVTQSSYAGGQSDAVAMLDALRSYLQVRIERLRALAEVVSSEADLERAAGTLPGKASAR